MEYQLVEITINSWTSPKLVMVYPEEPFTIKQIPDEYSKITNHEK